jgi:hypothetical protein
MEVTTMMVIVAMLLVGTLFLGPLLWRIWLDRSQAEADVVGAEIRAAVNRRLRGESFVAVRVTAPSLWRAGRVVLTTPSGYESLVEAVWSGVARRLPPGYELVFATADRAAVRSVRELERPGLPRAA